MPSTLNYPGVYIEEIPSGVRTITGVATSVTAFVGRALRGPSEDDPESPVTISSFGEFERTFGGLWLDSNLGYAVRDFFLNGGSKAIIARIHKGATPAQVSLPTGAAPPNDFLKLVAASVGAWGNRLNVTVDHQTKDATSVAPAPDPKLFNLAVIEADPVTKLVLTAERFLNVSTDPASPRFVARILEDSSDLVRVAKPGGVWTVPLTRPGAVTTPATVGSGGDGAVLDKNSFTGPGKDTTTKKGLYTLAKADIFNLLCLPPYLAAGDVDKALWDDAAKYCADRRAMLLIDPPSTWTTKAKAVTGVASDIGSTSKNAAVFFPRLRSPNPLRENQLEDYVPCGAVAGIMARTDAARGIWKAPAGLEATLFGVSELSVPLNDSENGDLNPLGVNCLRNMPGAGRVIWGARTREGNDLLASEWKYIPVRRLALYLEESLYRGTQWVVFEPNDEPLWAQIRLNIGAFMHGLFRQGAFQGKTPNEAYFVKCDKETTTQDDINRGIVNIVVGFAPLKPAEFVVIKLQQMAGQIQT